MVIDLCVPDDTICNGAPAGGAQHRARSIPGERDGRRGRSFRRESPKYDPVMGCTATFSAHNNMDDCPDLAVSAAYSAVTLSSVEDDGLSEELRVLLAHAMRGHHPANARRHDPPGPGR